MENEKREMTMADAVVETRKTIFRMFEDCRKCCMHGYGLNVDDLSPLTECVNRIEAAHHHEMARLRRVLGELVEHAERAPTNIGFVSPNSEWAKRTVTLCEQAREILGPDGKEESPKTDGSECVPKSASPKPDDSECVPKADGRDPIEPCPFCGGTCRVRGITVAYVKCEGPCGYESRTFGGPGMAAEAVEAHNRVYRAVAAYSKRGAGNETHA